ncbi:ankyrin repeat domain-containing protein [Bacteroidetes bacterium endosymbiont of Geopemphigus sp.]|uniref:ankyrin repeat domain-containing protein n=1 Tax=Bacteroidetes bacterium endosymbiont of Geopemphigus sp. TaxID=2047937 RepID=UPI0018A80EF2|nr:ankyrin repeat domain-containing protein [Bacteroidetes bacterium endosymbiont of Geopemphigus sp.]
MPASLLAIMCFSCNDDEPPVKNKSLSLEEVAILTQKSTKELSFTLGEDIKNKEIILVGNNPNDKYMEIKAPEFTYPKEWSIKIMPNETPENGKIKFKPGENELKYTLSGKFPDKEQSAEIKVAFAGKISTIALKLSSTVIKETESKELKLPSIVIEETMPKELIVGKNSRGEKVELTISPSEEVNGYYPIDISKSMTIAGQKNGLSVKIEGDSSITLEKGKKTKATYVIEGTPESDGDAMIKITIAATTKEIKIPIRYLRADEASFKLMDDNAKIEKTFSEQSPLDANTETTLSIKRVDDKEGEVKMKPSEVLAPVDLVNGIRTDLKEDGETIFKKSEQKTFSYTMKGTPLNLNKHNLTFKLKNNSLKIVQTFNVSEKKDKDGKTRLHIAAEKDIIKDINALIDKGAEVNAEDKYGYTPLHWAAMNKNTAAIKLLLEKGAKVSAEGKYNKVTPLHLAAETGIVEPVMALIEKGAEVNAEDKYDYTPLHWAARKGQAKVIEALTAAKAQINAKGKDGYTSLHLAAAAINNYKGAIKALIKAGADKKTTNKYGKKPFDITSDEELKKLLTP